MKYGRYSGIITALMEDMRKAGVKADSVAVEQCLDPLMTNEAWDRIMVDIAEGEMSMAEGISLFVGDAIHVRTEQAWIEDYRPSYQIAGPLLSGLLDTRLDLQAKHLRFPRRAFALEIPLEGPYTIQCSETKRMLESILVGVGSNVMVENAWFPQITNVIQTHKAIFDDISNVKRAWASYKPSIPSYPLTDQIVLNVSTKWAGIEWQKMPVSHLILKPDTVIDDVHYDISQRLAIGAALFAIGANNKFIDRIVEPRSSRRRRERDRKKGKPYEPETKRWRMGSSIALPSKGSSGSADDAKSTGGLQWAHTRQGYLRRQRVGSRSEGHFHLKYVRPTIVRPDLGFPENYQASKHSMWNPSKE